MKLVLGATVAAIVAATSGSVPVAGAAPAPPTPAPSFVPGHLIVEWEPGIAGSERADGRDGADTTIVRGLGSPRFQLLHVDAGHTTSGALRALRADPRVRSAERDVYETPQLLPDDPLLNQLWGLTDIGAPAAWDRTVGTPTTVVADIDTGYRFNHEDLGSRAWTNPGETANGSDDDSDGITDDLHGADFVGSEADSPTIDGDPTDDDPVGGGHGVHTAGTIGAAGNNGVGVTGVAQNARIMALRVCAHSTTVNDVRCPASAEISAINYAGAHGARVANMSLGGTTAVTAIRDAMADNPGVLFVISAGNDAVDNTIVPHFPCDFDPSTSAIAGAIDNVICVAAIDRNDNLASFSDWSATTVDLGAPGTEILSTFPHEVVFADNFEGPLTWTATTGAGFAPASDGPLTTNGLSDSPGVAPVASSTVASTSTGISIPAGEGGCTFAAQRFVRLEGGTFSYEILKDGDSIFLNHPADTAGSALFAFHTVPPITGLGGHSAQIRFTYTAGATPTADGGVWIDNTILDCITAVSATTGYGVLEGTSMAAPHVTGAAALLFSLKPTATVTEVRQALLSNTTPDPSLAGKTATGGRLDVSRAIDALVPPDTAIAAAPQDPTSDTTGTFTFTRADSTTAAATFECQLDGAAFAPCVSPASFPVAAGTHTFAVRAISPHGEIDPTPATTTWTVVAPPAPPTSTSTTTQAPPPPTPTTTATTATTTTATTTNPPSPKPKPTPTKVVCKVPRLTGKTLGSATAALRKAHCALGSVKRPKRHSNRRLVVTSSSPPAGRTRPKGTKVKLTLGPAKPVRHKH